jgi:hypothetical protein
MRFRKVPNAVAEPLVLEEVKALLKYAAERGLDQEGSIIKPLYLAVQRLEAGSQPAQPEPGGLLSSQDELRAEILRMYSQLTQLTRPVTGRTLVQTAQQFKSATRPLKLFGFLFLALAIGNEVLKAWFGDLPEPEEGWVLQLLNLRRYVLDYCTPFLWGALGSIAYLLKRLSDIAEERTFDYATAQGWATRVFLGAMLGGVVQYLYDSSVFINPEAGFKLSASALGFLTGVGVKVVYGAIEKTIETLGEKMNLNAIKSTKSDTASIRAYLNAELVKTDKDAEPEKRKVLLELLDELQEPKKQQ